MAKTQYLATVTAAGAGAACFTPPLSAPLLASFLESFGPAKLSDVGRRLVLNGDVIQMEGVDQMRERVSHDPDVPGWAPKVAVRVYQCDGCGATQQRTTNHTGKVWALRCVGKCRQIVNPHTAREVVLPFHGPHSYVCEAGQ